MGVRKGCHIGREAATGEQRVNWPIVWLAAAAVDRRRIVRYIGERTGNANVAVAFMDGMLRKIATLSSGTVQFRPGTVPETREYVVHPNCIVVYRVNDRLRRVEILRPWSVWSQPDSAR